MIKRINNLTKGLWFSKILGLNINQSQTQSLHFFPFANTNIMSDYLTILRKETNRLLVTYTTSQLWYKQNL
jgi:hypothetical protein